MELIKEMFDSILEQLEVGFESGRIAPNDQETFLKAI